MSWVTESVAYLIDASTQFRTHVHTATAVEALVVSIVVLVLRRYAMHDEKWADFFGWAFFIFFLRYTLEAGYLYSQEGSCDGIGETPEWLELLALLVSPINSLMLFASAQALLRRRKMMSNRLVALSVLGLISAFSAWYSDHPLLVMWHRIPDALLSVICVGWLGIAMYRCIQNGRRSRLAFLVLAVSMLYALLCIVDGLAPAIPRGLWPGLQSALGSRIGISSPGAVATAVDLGAMCLAFFLKLTLSIGALVILVRVLRVLLPRHAQEIMAEASRKREHCLSSKGLISAMVDVIDADAAELVLLRQGSIEMEARYWCWSKHGEKLSSNGEIRRLPVPGESTKDRVLALGQELLEENRTLTADEARLLSGDERDSAVVFGIPIVHNGGVIGCFIAFWPKGRILRPAIQRRTGEMIPWLAPIFQSQRQLDASSELSRGIHVFGDCLGQRVSIEYITRTLQKHLTPLASATCVNMGFQNIACTVGRDLGTTVFSIIDEHAGAVVRAALRALAKLSRSQKIECTSVPLEMAVFDNHDESMQLGELLFAVYPSSDHRHFPTLATDPVLQRAVAAQVSGELLDQYRQEYSDLLRDLRQHLYPNDQIATVDTWYRAIAICAEKAGLGWVVVSEPGPPEFHGPPHGVEIVESLTDDQLLPLRLHDESVCCYEVVQPGGKRERIVRLALVPTEFHAWLRVPRPGFGIEVSCLSPWLVFLQRFAESAGSALMFLTTTLELYELQKDDAQRHAFSQLALTHATLLHQLVNRARDVAGPTQTLIEGFRFRRMSERLDSESVRFCEAYFQEIRDAANAMGVLTRNLLRAGRIDERRSYQIIEAMKHGVSAFKAVLPNRRIRLELDIRSELPIGVPFDVVVHAISNLIDNAIKAIGRNGWIRIRAVDVLGVAELDTYVECTVEDSGPGIPKNEREHVFDLGFSTTDGSGWGLYLVDRSLKENGGSISLLEQEEGSGASFVIRLPRART